MMFKNKQLAIFVLLFFVFFTKLGAQDIVADYQKANQLLSIAQERDRLAAEALEEVKSRRLRIEEDLTYAQDNPKIVSKSNKKKLEEQAKVLKKKETELLQRRRSVDTFLLDVTDILQASPYKRANYISDYEKKFGEIRTEKTIGNASPIIPSPPSVNVQKPVDRIAQLEGQSSPPPVTNSTEMIEAGQPAQKNIDAKNTHKKVPKKAQKSLKQQVNQNGEEGSLSNVSKSQSSKKTKEVKPRKKDIHKIVEPMPIAEPITSVESEKPIVIQPISTEMISPISATKKKKNKSASSKSSAASSVSYKNYDIKEDVMFNPPPQLDCNLAFDGMDNFTGKKKQETIPIVLFTHTEDFMRPALKGKEFITCEATATRVEGSRVVYLNLAFVIESKDAQRTFGFLDRGSMVIFRLINGKKINLSTNKTDIGAVDYDKGTTTFRAQLVVPEIIELTQSELDAVRISWSIGYEDYEVFDMEVLRNLFKCLDKK